MPFIEEVHDPALTSVVIAHILDQSMFIADKASPPRLVGKSTDRYTTYTKKDWTTIAEDLVSDEGPSKVVRWGTSFTTYNTVGRGLKSLVTDKQLKQQSGSIDLEADTVKFLGQQVMLAREKRVADLLFNTTTFSGYTAALSTANQWDNYTSASSDPIDDIETAKQNVLLNSGFKPNTVILGYQPYRYARNHPIVLDRIKEAVGGEVKNINERLLAQAFDVDQVLVGRATYTSSNPGQSSVTDAFIWGKFALVAYIEPTFPRKGVTLGGTFRFEPFQVTRWRSNDPRGTWFRVGLDDAEVVTATVAGYLYSTVVS